MDHTEVAAAQGDQPDDRIWVTAHWKQHQALALVDGGSQIDLISPSFVNQLRIPWRLKKQPCVVKGPFETQVARRETEPLSITVEGKTTEVIFDIVDMVPKKDMILGRPWHRIYDPDISWKGGGHLRPRSTTGSHPTNTMGSADDESRRRSTTRQVHFEDSPQETDGTRKRATDSRKGGSHPGKRRTRRQSNQEVAVISVDDNGFQLQE